MIVATNRLFSDDDRLLIFSSSSPDLVQPDSNGLQDVFVRDLMTMRTRLISLNQTGGDRANGARLGACRWRFLLTKPPLNYRIKGN